MEESMPQEPVPVKNGKAVAALIFGVGSLIFTGMVILKFFSASDGLDSLANNCLSMLGRFTFGFYEIWWGIFGVPIAIVGLAFSVSARKISGKQESGIETAGLVCSYIGLILNHLIYFVAAFPLRTHIQRLSKQSTQQRVDV